MVNISMRFFEFTNAPSMQQNRVNTLKQQKERITTQLKAEKDKIKQQKATQQMIKATQQLAKLRNN